MYVIHNRTLDCISTVTQAEYDDLVAGKRTEVAILDGDECVKIYDAGHWFATAQAA